MSSDPPKPTRLFRQQIPEACIRGARVTIISREHRFIYLKSLKTAGTSVEAHLIARTPLGKDIWYTAGEIKKFHLPLKRRYLLLPMGEDIFAHPAFALFSKVWPRKLRVQEHQDAAGVSSMVGGFWDGSIKATNVRNPWDLMVSAWQWRRDGRGGRAAPISATFHEWLSAALSGDREWQMRVGAYDPQFLINPFLFLDGRCAVDVIIRQESIDAGLQELGTMLGLDLGTIAIHEKKSGRKPDYRTYYSDILAEAVQQRFVDLIRLCDYSFG
jgi:hypothetical protein